MIDFSIITFMLTFSLVLMLSTTRETIWFASVLFKAFDQSQNHCAVFLLRLWMLSLTLTPSPSLPASSSPSQPYCFCIDFAKCLTPSISFITHATKKRHCCSFTDISELVVLDSSYKQTNIMHVSSLSIYPRPLSSIKSN